jgi:VanZ family protein
MLVVRSLAPLALMGAIFVLSSQTGGDPLPWWEVTLRKLAHFGGYAALALLWAWALAPEVSRPLLPGVAIAVLYAVSDEYHQSFVEGRRGTAVDVAIDALGATAAAVLITVLRRREPSLARTQGGRRSERT